MNVEEKKSFLTNISFIAVSAALIYLVSKFLLSYLLPFVIGIILAFVVQKPARKTAKKFKISVGTCAAVLVTLSYAFLVCVAAIAVWFLISFVSRTATRLPDILNRLTDILLKMKEGLSNSFSALPNSSLDELFGNIFDTLSSKLTAFFSSLAANAAKNIPALLLSSVVTVVASFYIAKDFEKLMKFFRNLIKPETYKRITVIKGIIMQSVVKLAAGYLLIMLITFIELAFGLLLMDVKYFLIIAVLISFVDLLPVLGTGTVLLPWALFSFVTDDNVRGTGLIVLYIAVTVIRNFLEPKIIGKRVGINPLLTLITMFVGLRVAGFAGMIILPITVIVIIKYYKKQLDEERGEFKAEISAG